MSFVYPLLLFAQFTSAKAIATATVSVEASLEAATTISPVFVDLKLGSDSPAPAHFIIEGLRYRLLAEPVGSDVREVASACDLGTRAIAGSFPLLRGTVSAKEPFSRRFLLSECYGKLAPGSYTLHVRALLLVDKEARSLLPGAPVAPSSLDFLSSAGDLRQWELPEQVVSFTVRQANDEQRSRVLQVFGEREAKPSREQWMSLILMDTEASWEILSKRADDVPQEAARIIEAMLLTHEDRQTSVDRARQVLTDRSNWVSRVAMQVIAARGHRSDAAFVLRRAEASGDANLKGLAYSAVRRLLDRPSKPELQTRPVNDADLRELQALASTAPSE